MFHFVVWRGLNVGDNIGVLFNHFGTEESEGYICGTYCKGYEEYHLSCGAFRQKFTNVLEGGTAYIFRV
jgi:hypothetical protein